MTTTDQSLGGPPANLAGLFQIVGVSKQSDGSSEVWATWTNSLPRFGVDAAVVVTVVHGWPLKMTGGWKPLIHGCTAYSSL